MYTDVGSCTGTTMRQGLKDDGGIDPTKASAAKLLSTIDGAKTELCSQTHRLFRKCLLMAEKPKTFA